MSVLGWDSCQNDFWFWTRADVCDLERATGATLVLRMGGPNVNIPLAVVPYLGKPRLYVDLPPLTLPNGIEVSVAFEVTMDTGATVRVPAQGFISVLVFR